MGPLGSALPEPAGAWVAIFELLSPAALLLAEADESAPEVPVLLIVSVVLVSVLELHELRASRQAAKRGKEARSIVIGGEKGKL
ncbi:hypothetical protein GCM10023172_24570 [Hymenobacter ginsengisoli]|uniref:Uncharacterized protein n=1 Tax=Hymenobacter ginsengisoli TaxID=1051626 RepID=A0ABP8QHR5_9BACT